MLKIGHRGACGYEPENTIRSFKRAAELGADAVELDVQFSADKKIVVFHDSTLDRVTNGRGTLSKKTLTEIKQYRTKQANEPIPTLEEVFQTINNRVKINVEIKGFDTELARTVCDLVRSFGLEKSIIISSSHLCVLSATKKYAPEISRAIIYYSSGSKFLDDCVVFFSNLFYSIVSRVVAQNARRIGAEYLNFNHRLMNSKRVRAFQKWGFKINVWTVNDPKMIAEMKNAGVDGIFSNYPDRL